MEQVRPNYWKRARTVVFVVALVFLINEIIGGFIDGRF